MRKLFLLVAVAYLCGATWAMAADEKYGLEKGPVELKSAGPLAFGPDGILFIGDTEQAAVLAIATGDTSGNPEQARYELASIDEKIAAALGTTAREIRIADLAVNPLSGNVYLSVARGQGPDAAAVLLRVDPSGQLEELDLKNIPHAEASIPNPPEARTGRNSRAESITDLAYVEGRLLVAGLSNEEFASKLRSIPFPFSQDVQATSVEIYHGAHGAFETRSPVRTFATYEIQQEPHILAAYTCTPLVKFPLKQLEPGAKIRGVTLAELGNRNRPLDMIIYSRDGQDYILMANSSRGVMKISTEGVERSEGIVEKINETAGQSYETLEQLKGVEQLDRLNQENALVLVRQESGNSDLLTIALP